MGTDRILKIATTGAIDVDALEEAFDEATHAQRVAATRQFDKNIQRTLWEAAVGRSVPFDQIVPTEEPLKEVIHVGTNTIPVFREFEKRFCRPPTTNGAEVAFGYNENWYKFATSPGYYVAEQEENGEFLVDYTRLPDQKPGAWPKIRSNAYLLGIFVFYGMKDRLRRVSEHVTIGRAYKKKPMNQYFVLVRDDASFS